MSNFLQLSSPGLKARIRSPPPACFEVSAFSAFMRAAKGLPAALVVGTRRFTTVAVNEWERTKPPGL